MLQQDWRGKKVHVGVALRERRQVYQKFLQEQPEEMLVTLPEVRCEEWFKEFENARNEKPWTVDWVELSSVHDNALVDEHGDGVGRFPFKLWMVHAKTQAGAEGGIQ